MIGKVCGATTTQTIFDMNQFVPQISVNTARVLFSRCAGVFCLDVKFANKAGCSFNKWDIFVKASMDFKAVQQGTGWVKVIGNCQIG